MYGGITLFDGEKPVVDICKDYRITPRNVYSNMSTLFLSAYTFQPFSFLEFKIKVNTTTCKPIIFNTCQIQKFQYKYEKNCHLCHQFIQNPRSGIKVKINLVRLTYLLKLGKCFVIQFANDLPLYTEPCIVFSPDYFPESNGVLQYEILGVFQVLKPIASNVQQHHLKLVTYSSQEANIQTSFKNWSHMSCFGVKCRKYFEHVQVFSSNLTIFTPELSSYLYFNLWKSYFFNIDIKISYFTACYYQWNMGFEEWRSNKSVVKFSNHYNSDIFAVQIQNNKNCFGEFKNNSVLKFQLSINSSTYTGNLWEQFNELSMCFHLSCLEPVFYLSLPGHMFWIQYKNFTPYFNHTVVTSFWMNGILRKHNHFKCHINCDKLFGKLSQAKYTLNISHQAMLYKFQNRLIYMMFRSYRTINNKKITLQYPFIQLQKYVRKIKYFSDESLHHSWKTPSHLCKELGGHLPVFYDRADIEEFTSFFKVAKVPLVYAIFIGLFFD